ncbi:MAG: GNAT family N-acetyltransferase [Planctomycetota bacterium]
MDALHLVFGASKMARDRINPVVEDLLNARRAGVTNLDSFLGAFLDDKLIAAAVVAASPGGAGLVLLGATRHDQVGDQALVRALRSATARAWSSGTTLVQGLCSREESHIRSMLRAGGFHHLTTLVYLSRELAKSAARDCRTDLEARGATCAGEISWTTYEESTRELFLKTVEASYVQSQDCPEISGSRSVSDALETHAARHNFDKGLWAVCRVGGVPAGVVLLNRIGPPDGLEIVYIGVAHTWRGRGVADTMLAWTDDMAMACSATYVTLAVDVRNAPALGMYARWGYRELFRRDAFVAVPADKCLVDAGLDALK